MTIIVSGWIRVDAGARAAYLDGCLELVAQARVAPGCLAFHLSADPLEPDRINVFEQWESVADVEAFRGSGPPDEQSSQIIDAQVFQHELGSSVRL